MIAHVGGVPLEEILLPLMSGLGGVLLVVRARVMTRFGHPGRGQHTSSSTPSRSPTNSDSCERR